jgi:hypothetical protein
MRMENRILKKGVSVLAWWSASALSAILIAVPSSASIVNGNFDSGLAGWSTLGEVAVSGDADVSDSNADYSALYQAVALGAGLYRLEFDLETVLSGDLSADPFAFPDGFFASLYLTNDLGAFDLPGGVFDDVLPLLDADDQGLFNVAGTLSASPLGAGWTHFAYQFSNSYAYAIPAFELIDLNFVAGDSHAGIDNVTLTPVTGVVPEPATLSLLALGLAGFAVRRKVCC